jgi:hypothetical protein
MAHWYKKIILKIKQEFNHLVNYRIYLCVKHLEQLNGDSHTIPTIKKNLRNDANLAGGGRFTQEYRRGCAIFYKLWVALYFLLVV